MNCALCESKEYIEILNKKETVIWTNLSDDLVNDDSTYKCILYQCNSCGHVYQPVKNDLRNILNRLYLSNHAQATTAMGRGNWGLERVKSFLSFINFNSFKSAMEIGCADGYLLRYLKSVGFKELAGIEPSIKKTENRDGILFMKEFANDRLSSRKKYDLIFSAWTFEHIENLYGVIKFCRSHLHTKGCLFLSVPNAQMMLSTGDPALFLHQHIHYFTEESLRYLLSKNGFRVNSIISCGGDFMINASVGEPHIEISPEIKFYYDYQKKLKKVLIKAKNILKRRDLIVHGANHALSNILAWLNEDFNFVLVDNDNTKHNRTFSGKIVNTLNEINLAAYMTLLIIPNAFLNAIKSDYLKRGFKGKIENLLPS